MTAIRILNRVIEWTSEGIEYEADQRHAEIIIRDVGLDSSVKTAITPGVKMTAADKPVKDIESSSSQAIMYRAVTARANYLSQDRSDIQFAVKELCRKMSSPTEFDWDD